MIHGRVLFPLYNEIKEKDEMRISEVRLTGNDHETPHGGIGTGNG